MVSRKLLAAGIGLLLLAAACANTPTDRTTATPTGGAAAGTYEFLDRAKAGEFRGTSVEVLAQWIEPQDEIFRSALQPFIDQTGIDVDYEGINDYTTVLTARVEGGNAPDVAQIAQPGLMQSFADNGDLVNLSDWFNLDKLQEDYNQTFIDLGSVGGDLYGVFYQANLKSIVWYPVTAFQENGYEIPQTWDELIALSDQIVADGNGNPWCISTQQDGVNGWVATDWIEDVLLRTAPVEVYDQWVAHEIPFDSPEVINAANLVGEIFFTPDYVYGGNTGINAIWVGDTQTPMFDPAGPKCWMHKQAAWITDFWPKDPDTEEPLFEAGVDSSFFYFPSIDEEFERPVLGAGDMFVMFDDRPEVRALFEYLATPEAVKAWIDAGGFVSANDSVPAEWYTNYKDQAIAEILGQSTALRFDASDSLPAEVGGTFLSGMVDWIRDNGGNTDAILEQIEASWPSG